MQTDKVRCLITLESANPESYMFHTPNIHMVCLQAKAMDFPLITMKTKGEKESELEDLKKALSQAVDTWEIEGVVTGAINSVYQASRAQRICDELDLWCFNPLWQMKPDNVLQEILEAQFEVIISSISAYPLDEKWLGKKIDKRTVEELLTLQEKYGISPAGEGGEFETLVLNGPMFKKRIQITQHTTSYNNNAGEYTVKGAVLE